MIAIQQPLFYQPHFKENIDTYGFLEDEKQISLDLHEKG